MQTARDGDFETFALLWDIVGEVYEQRQSFLTTRILEDQKIAYLAMPTFFGGFGAPTIHVAYYEEKIFNFYHEIQGFQHLIVDLRGNLGGFWEYIFRMVVAPNISETAIADGFVFLIRDTYNMRFVSGAMNLHNNLRGIRGTPGTDTMTVAEILEGFYLPELNVSDMYRLDYGFQIQTFVHPRRLTWFDYRPAFDGKIWLLTDRHMYSAAELVARFVQETGFATLVGEVTGGAFGGRFTRRTLPNSPLRIDFDLFYITDSRGRPLEAGTIPHHFNRPGMDALETTLALIAEGQ